MIKPELHKKFLTKTDETGRFIVYSPKTGITYYVEPIDGKQRVSWGNVDPVSKQTTGDYGAKYKGSIKPSESLITPENGFQNIDHLDRGVSPLGTIDEIDNLRYEEGFRPKA